MKIIFTHIPKTAGTSFVHQIVHSNFLNSEVLNLGPRNLLKMNSPQIKFIYGHRPYGLHKYVIGKSTYITFLRKPVDRAISHYYFILGCSKNGYEHPLFNICKNNSLETIYEKNLLANNLMSRFLAGANPNAIVDQTVLDRAKLNLEKNYPLIGLKERYDLSLKAITEYFDWEYQMPSDSIIHKKTEVKPVVPPKIIELLEHYHSFDSQLYQFAEKLFFDRLK